MSATFSNAEIALRRHRLTVKAFHRMGDAGIVTASERVELIEGELLDMSPIGSHHAGTVLRLNQLLNRAVGDAALVAMHNPVTLDDHSEPEPDIVLLRPQQDFYIKAHPGAGDVLLLIEVADTSLAYDRDIKIPLYARYGIPEVWLLDLPGESLEIHRQPSSEGYRMVLRPARDDTVSPLCLPTVRLRAGKVFVPLLKI